MAVKLGMLLSLVCFIPASAQNVQRIKVFVSNGTGFIVNKQGYVLTNAHVVPQCERITLNGKYKDMPATLVAKNDALDLALLKTPRRPFMPAKFRNKNDALVKDQPVVLVGYPEKAQHTGVPITKEARLLALSGPNGDTKWLQLSNVVRKGNSGGPLMDSASNIIGVIQAQATIYTYKENKPNDGKTTHAGLAISQEIVERFLRKHKVQYNYARHTAPNSTYRVTRKAKDFIVRVKCEYRTEVIS